MQPVEDTLNIETPENVAFGYEIAGIGSRFLAALVDTSIITLLQVLIGILILFLWNTLFGTSSSMVDKLGAWLLAIVGLLVFAVYWVYYILFEILWNGQSPGKRWVGLRVIRTDGTPITLAESSIRNLVRIVDLLPSFYGIGIIVMFVDGRSRRLGDLAAGTLVVRDQASITLDSLARSPNPVPITAMLQPKPDFPVHLLKPPDLRLAEDFLHRRADLFNRQELAERIAQSLCEHMELQNFDNLEMEPEEFIEQVVRLSRAR